MCSFTKKNLQLLGDFVPQTPYWGSAPGPRWGTTPYRGSAPRRRWGTSVPQTPSLLLCPPNNPERSTPLHGSHLANTTERLVHAFMQTVATITAVLIGLATC